MAKIHFREMNFIEKCFNMGGGYVLDFSNSKFEEFIKNVADVDISNDKYKKDSGSKANRLRAYFELHSNAEVAKLIEEMVELKKDTFNDSKKHMDLVTEDEIYELSLCDQCLKIARDLRRRSGAPSDELGVVSLSKLDSDHIKDLWQGALERREADPEGAITLARSLLEAVCKFVLDDAGDTYKETDDLPKLYGSVSKRLKIAPSQHSEETFKRILGGCHTIVENIGTLRNKVGDAHGRGRRPVRPAPRHAALAVNLAGSMATFIADTWKARTGEE